MNSHPYRQPSTLPPCAECGGKGEISSWDGMGGFDTISCAKCRCTQRVWDNGDSTNCGKPVLRVNRCAEHIAIEVRTHEETIAECKQSIAASEARIAELLGGIS
jgi:hypothetical protein